MEREFFKKKLGNGTTILFEKRELPIISVMLATRFGSAYEKETEKGLAHFIEHMLYGGTKRRNAKQIAEEIEEKGGEHNAFTARTFTAAWMKLPSKYLEFSLELLSDLFFNSIFGKEKLETERKAILEEIKMYHDHPMRHVFEELNKLMYEKPFGLPALGTESSVSSFSREKLFQEYKKRYFTENLFLVVVGNADFEDICFLCEKYFKKSSGEKILFMPKKSSGEKTEKRKSLDQAHLALGIHFPKLSDKEKYAAKIFHSIFADGMASKIWQEVREKRGLAYAVLGMYEQETTNGEEIIYLGVGKDRVEEAKKIVLEEFSKMKNLEKKEFEKAKEKLISAKLLESEDSRNVLFNLALEETSGKAEEYYKYEERIKNVKLEDVSKIAKLKNFSSFALVPE